MTVAPYNEEAEKLRKRAYIEHEIFMAACLVMNDYAEAREYAASSGFSSEDVDDIIAKVKRAVAEQNGG